MADTENQSFRALAHPDGSVYHLVRAGGVMADAEGVSCCEVVVILRPDGRRIGSAHLTPGVSLPDLDDEQLVALLDEVLDG